jgi:geranylgeranyl pyrophosphate synthase
MEALAAEARQKLSAFPDGEPRQALVLMIDYFIERNR